jgi:hypothetical protein
VISVLLPSRGRPKQLTLSVNSLLETADEPDRVEILCAVDADDEKSLLRCKTLADLYRPSFTAWTSPERFGYARLHEYVNFLASEATGDWLMVWNDDAQMVTKGWDSVIEAHTVPEVAASCAGRPTADKVLWPQANHAQGGNLFPVWPQAWYHNLGYVSLAPNIDVWVSELGRCLDVEVPVPIQIQHDRADVTGGNNDQTYAEGRALMGQGNDPGYDSLANRMERARAVKVLGQLYRTEKS